MAFENIRDNAQRTFRDGAQRLREIAPQISENPNLAVGMAASGLALGMLGYLAGRSYGKRLAHARVEKVREAVREARAATAPAFDFTPVYKLVKLWMLYRIAV